MKGRSNKIYAFIKKHHLDSLRDVVLFIVITGAIHLIWKVWQTQFEYAPITGFMYGVMGAMSAEVYREWAWIMSGIIDVVRVDEYMQLHFQNKAIMYVNNGCSGLKQILQFTLLMLIFPGPWKKKLWFIPFGILVMHLTNLFRMFGLAVIMANWPDYWHFSHDYIFRLLFYLVIFLLWLWWVEKLSSRRQASDVTSPHQTSNTKHQTPNT